VQNEHNQLVLLYFICCCGGFRGNIASIQPDIDQSKPERLDLPHAVLLPYRLLLLVPCMAYSSTLKMEAIWFSGTSGCLQTTQCEHSEDRVMHSHLLEKLKFNTRTD
jgi:hypothetical protein